MPSTSPTAKQLSPNAKLEGRIFGVDEAGRGAMAGPLSVAAVEFPWPKLAQEGRVKDSKKLTPKARVDVCKEIMALCKYACVLIPPEWIDEHGIQAAETSGLIQCIDRLRTASIEEEWPDLIVADGNRATWGLNDKSLGVKMEARLHFMIKGDQHVQAISAASIVAKVVRDNYMQLEAHEAYPAYRFDLHVGYVTPLHLAKLEEYGSCGIHRHTFGPVKERDAVTQ